MTDKCCPECMSVDNDIEEPPQHKLGDCSECHDEDVMLVMSDQEDELLHYICKECHFRGL